MYTIIFFILGTVMGSFYTVVGLRLPKKEDFIKGRSHCDKCKHELYLYEMIPILSYILQKGKCRYCHEKIDAMMPLMEFFSGLLFAVSYYSYGFSLDLLIALGIVSLLLIVMVTDLTYLIIPDEVLIFFSIYFIIVQFFRVGWKATLIHILTGLFLFAIMYLIMLLGNKLLHKESLGGGDIKLMFLFGLVLDPLLGVLSIFFGSLFALPISLVILIKQKERLIPFGPFLLMAFAFIFFTKITSSMVISFLGF
jgi:leader peptidase (prepilin peptidase)/N-methyltransferase